MSPDELPRVGDRPPFDDPAEIIRAAIALLERDLEVLEWQRRTHGRARRRRRSRVVLPRRVRVQTAVCTLSQLAMLGALLHYLAST